jgi:hypothetical protein
VSSSLLSEFPTYNEDNETVGGNTSASINETYDGVKELLRRVPELEEQP